MSITKGLRRSERGQVLAIGVIMSTALLGMIGLVIDGGRYYSERRQVQNAADEAALAATYLVYHGGSSAEAQAIAEEYAFANGYEADQVTFHHPPTSGPHQGDAWYAEVIIEEEPSSFFIHVLLDGGVVAARGVAGLERVPGQYALIVLDEFQCESFFEEGTPFTINNGGMMVNSACEPDGFSKIGSGNLTVDGDIHVNGGISISGSGSVSPEPEQVPWQVPDPLADVTPPARGTAMPCPAGGATGTAANPLTCQFGGPTNRTLNPGTYYGGLDISCQCTVTLNPGIYVISGGGFSKSGGAAVVGTETMIYVTTNPAHPTGAGAPLPFDLSGNGTLNIDPITVLSSPYYGISLWQDKNITADFYLAGDVGGTTGVLYVPGAEMDVAGASAMNGIQIIAKNFNIRGNTAVTLNFTNWVDADVPRVFLVE